MSEWTSVRDYLSRVANIRGSGSTSRSNGDNYLLADGLNATVFDDAVKDVLTGSAGTDWFVANLSDGALDKITDLLDSEFADDLDWILLDPL